MGQFKNLQEDDGMAAMGSAPDFGLLQFKCSFANCPEVLTYDEFINERAHEDCDYRPYKCIKCKQVIAKKERVNHRINLCKSKASKCDYCQKDIEV